jgi:hypothetical protein
MENSRLRQLALLDLGILNFGLMRACRREDAPLRIDRYTIRDGFLLRAPHFGSEPPNRTLTNAVSAILHACRAH